MADPEVLGGGVANAGAVVREGAYVLRPASRSTPVVHELLRWVRAAGFTGVPEPVGIEPDGRERLVYIPGEVAVPPFPAWIQTDRSLGSIAELLASFHEAVAGFCVESDRDGDGWNIEMADPEPGDLLCHNDVCPENVVFRDGVAVALLDFDFVALGRRLYDLAGVATMCIPLDTAADAAVWGWGALDPVRRLRVVADAYGLPPGRQPLVDVIEQRMASGNRFLRRRVERGEQAFVDMWDRMGGAGRYERRVAWLRRHRERFLEALG
ncbi:MAG: phosphotransferase [Acidimicrobiales bacterium]